MVQNYKSFCKNWCQKLHLCRSLRGRTKSSFFVLSKYKRSKSRINYLPRRQIFCDIHVGGFQRCYITRLMHGAQTVCRCSVMVWYVQARKGGGGAKNLLYKTQEKASSGSAVKSCARSPLVLLCSCWFLLVRECVGLYTCTLLAFIYVVANDGVCIVYHVIERVFILLDISGLVWNTGLLPSEFPSSRPILTILSCRSAADRRTLVDLFSQ